jgi:FkbM family methyltransferase
VPVGDTQRSLLVADRSELETLREVFVRGEYDVPELAGARTIVDVGSNVGISVLYFRQRFPAARIVAVEPDPGAFGRLVQNTAGLAAIELVNAALAESEGQATLYTGGESWAASLVPGPDRKTRQAVRTTTLEGLTRELSIDGIDLLKLDIEGAEVPVLLSARVLDRVRLLVFEYHREYAAVTLWELLEHLSCFELRRLAGTSEDHVTVVLENRRKSETVRETMAT